MFRLLSVLVLIFTFGIGQMWGADPTIAFNETFASCTGTMGWSGSVANGTFTADNSGWTTSNQYGAGGAARFGTGNALGKAETPSINCGTATTATLTFKAGAWNGSSESTTLKLSYTNCSGDASVSINKGSWTDCSVTLSNINGNIKIKFEGNTTKNSRFFLDDVKVTYTANTPSCSKTPTMSFIPDAVEKTVGDDNFAKEVTISGQGGSQTVAYSSSNTDVATVNSSTGEVTIKTNGSTTITASVSESGDYCSASASYTLTVNKPSYTVNWYVGGNLVKTESVTKDETATLPPTPADNALGGSCSSLVFRGWSETNIGSTGTTAPADLFTVAPTITSAKNYYAVFATETNEVINIPASEKSYSVEITSSQLADSYASSNGDHSSTGTANDASSKTVEWTSSNVNNASGELHFKSNEGYIYNKSSWGTITNISFSDNESSYNVYIGTSASPTTAGSGGFFKIAAKKVSGGPSVATITITFSQGSPASSYEETTYSNYNTSCCTQLDQINGSVLRTHF